MKKVRIVKRTEVGGDVWYIIQQRHFFFRWWWVDASLNSGDYANCIDYFGTLDEAKENLCYYDGSKSTEEVVG